MGNRQSGNIFFALFGAIALVGILGAGVMTFMKGPLATSVKLTRQNTAETQMALGAQVAVMAAANTASSGDCDSDGFVEPLEWRDAGTDPKPTGGGLVPMSIGMTKKDPWGTEYGYCAWDYGTFGAAGCGGGTEKRLQGDITSGAYPVVALVSAGSDKTFTTTCRSFAAADVNSDGDLLDAVDLPLVSKAVETDDDIIFTYTYDEATGASGGLWSIKSGDPGTAVISKNIEATGTANLQGGVLLPDSALITCDATTAGVMARNSLGTGIDICDGTGWTSISGGGASDGFNNDNTVACDGTTVGQVRYNTTSQLPEFCNGTQWLPFTINIPGVNLVITPQSSNSMNVDGATNADTTTCTVASGMYCGNPVTFTVTNQGTATSAALVVSISQFIGGVNKTVSPSTSPAMTSVTNATNFVVTSNTCSGATLAANASCSIIVEPKSNGNETFTGILNITANNNPLVVMQGSSTNFGCLTGRQGGGGYYLACGLNDGDGSYNLVIMPSGCNGGTTNPTCSGGTDGASVRQVWGSNNITIDSVCSTNGICKSSRNSVNLEYLRSTYGYSFPANSYCQDMQYNSYTDWYLPEQWEFQNYLYNAITAGKLTGFASDYYWTSTLSSSYPTTSATMYRPYDGLVEAYYDSPSMTLSRYIRCVRRENLPLRTVSTDTNPNAVTIRPKVSFSSGVIRTSNTVTIDGILQPINVSIAGGTSMDIIKNGVSQGSTSIANVRMGDTLAFSMAAPTTIGTKSTATITIGDDVYTWWVGYADSSVTAKIFVTSTTYRGDGLGGLAGADNICKTRAAASPFGLGSYWKAVLSSSTVDASARIPWNWGTLKNLSDTTIVSGGVEDLWDGSIASPISISELGTTITTYAWTSSNLYGEKDSGSFSGSNNGCQDWTGNQDSYTISGSPGSSGSAWFQAGGVYCSDSRPLYCIEDTDDTSDTTPNVMSLPYKVQVPLSTRTSSSSITVGGMSSSATQTLTVTATGGNPAFTINGGADVTSGSIRNGDALVFKIDSPAVANTSYKMTITAGTMTTYWRVWSGPATSGITKRVFVTSTDPNGASFGGAAGADTACQTRATAASLGGTWKAIISGISESEWAVNRVGYNWDTLKLIDGTTTVVNTPGGLWTTLLHSIDMTETGTTRSSVRVLSGTASDGRSYSSVADLSNLYNWTGASCSATYMQGNSSSLSATITQGYWLCQSDGALYCIEQ